MDVVATAGNSKLAVKKRDVEGLLKCP